jgi:hypothetical protein
MISMLRNIVYEGQRIQHVRKTWLFYSARAKSDQAFGDELDDLAVASGGNVRIYRLLSNTEGAESRVNYDAVGRIDMGVLKRTLPLDDYDYYLCGPPAFMQDTYAGLRALNIADSRIYAESFGPGSIHRTSEDKPLQTESNRPATLPTTVIFTEAGKESRWTPESGTLLELAEASGLTPEFGCRERVMWNLYDQDHSRRGSVQGGAGRSGRRRSCADLLCLSRRARKTTSRAGFSSLFEPPFPVNLSSGRRSAMRAPEHMVRPEEATPAHRVPSRH